MLYHKLPVALCLTALPDSCCSSGCASGGFSVPKQRQSHQEEPRGAHSEEPVPHGRASSWQLLPESHTLMVSLLTHEGMCQVNGQAKFHLSLHMCHAWCQLQTRDTGVVFPNLHMGQVVFQNVYLLPKTLPGFC